MVTMAQRTSFLLALLAVLSLHRTVRAEDEYVEQFTVCPDSPILVDEMSMTCDSPGSYYYGGNVYRNSDTCMGGDKGKFQFIFEIVEDLEASPLLSVNIQAYGSVPAVELYNHADLCYLSSLKSLDGAACPAAGQYMISEKFYFEDQNDAYEYNFKPVPSIGFMSGEDVKYFDLGGANTDDCDGGAFQHWSSNFQKTISKAITFFLATLGVMFVFSMVFVAWRYTVLKRERQWQSTPKASFQAMQDEMLDDDDVRRIAMLARERDLIDA